MKTILVDAVHTFVIRGEGIFQDLYDLLESYPHPKILLTNADDEQLKQFGLEDMPYEVFSCKHEPNKDEPAYFHKLLSHFNLAPDDVVYFDHKEEAVASAEQVGITSFHYDSHKQDLEALQTFLDTHLSE